MNNKKKRIILIALISVLAILAAAILFYSYRGGKAGTPFQNKEAEQFLGDTEKEFYGLDKGTKAQAFYDENGELQAYKIIRQDSDIVSDPVKAGLAAPSR